MKRTLENIIERLEGASTQHAVGRVRSAIGTVVRATLPGSAIGEIAEIHASGGQRVLAEVVGFEHEEVILMPLGHLRGVQPGSRVELSARTMSVRVSPSLRGRVLDPLGQPLDGEPLPDDAEPWPVVRPAPRALTRRRIDRPLHTGMRVLDGLLTLGQGQRLGLFAPAGVGKSTLLGQLAQRAEVDVVVVGLVGERGREVRAFLEDALGPTGLARSVVVVASADAPPQARVWSAFVATAIAEYFRDRQGQHVLLLIDSLTRVARAQREVGLAAGEPPVQRGYPPSLFALLSRLVERAGNSDKGCMSAVYSVLMSSRDQMDDPVADEVSGLLDGHVVLSRELASRGHFPAVDVLSSLSRLMPSLVSSEHRDHARRVRQLLSAYASRRDLIELGAYRRGSDPDVDEALEIWSELEDFLQQERGVWAEPEETREQLWDLVG